MMRYIGLLLLSLLLVGSAVSAQEATPENLDDQIRNLEAMATQVSDELNELQELAEQASNDVNNTFSLLGLLEAFSFVVTIVGGAAALVGITRFVSAQQDLQEARQRFEDEIENSSKRLEEENTLRQREFAELRESLEKSTSHATLALSFLPLGEGQYKSGDFNGALDIYHRALALDPDNPIINYRLGYVYTQSGRLDDAERYLQQALNIEPDFAPALATLGYVYRRRGEKMNEGIDRVTILNKAEQHLVRALKLSPKLVDEEGESWWGSLGGLYRRRGQIDQAIYAYEQAAQVMPNSSYAFSNLALLFMQQRNRAKMLETYAQVEKLAANEVQADVDNYWAYTDLVTSRLALGKIDEAERALEAVFRATPDDSPYVLEAMLDTQKRLAEALDPQQAAPVQEFAERIGSQIARKKEQAEAAAAEEAQAAEAAMD